MICNKYRLQNALNLSTDFCFIHNSFMLTKIELSTIIICRLNSKEFKRFFKGSNFVNHKTMNDTITVFRIQKEQLVNSIDCTFERERLKKFQSD